MRMKNVKQSLLSFFKMYHPNKHIECYIEKNEGELKSVLRFVVDFFQNEFQFRGYCPFNFTKRILTAIVPVQLQSMVSKKYNPQKDENMKVFLDDERKPPDGWVLVRWPEEAIDLLKTNQVTE